MAHGYVKNLVQRLNQIDVSESTRTQAFGDIRKSQAFFEELRIQTDAEDSTPQTTGGGSCTQPANESIRTETRARAQTFGERLRNHAVNDDSCTPIVSEGSGAQPINEGSGVQPINEGSGAQHVNEDSKVQTKQETDGSSRCNHCPDALRTRNETHHADAVKQTGDKPLPVPKRLVRGNRVCVKSSILLNNKEKDVFLSEKDVSKNKDERRNSSVDVLDFEASLKYSNQYDVQRDSATSQKLLPGAKQDRGSEVSMRVVHGARHDKGATVALDTKQETGRDESAKVVPYAQYKRESDTCAIVPSTKQDRESLQCHKIVPNAKQDRGSEASMKKMPGAKQDRSNVHRYKIEPSAKQDNDSDFSTKISPGAKQDRSNVHRYKIEPSAKQDNDSDFSTKISLGAKQNNDSDFSTKISPGAKQDRSNVHRYKIEPSAKQDNDSDFSAKISPGAKQYREIIASQKLEPCIQERNSVVSHNREPFAKQSRDSAVKDKGISTAEEDKDSNACKKEPSTKRIKDGISSLKFVSSAKQDLRKGKASTFYVPLTKNIEGHDLDKIPSTDSQPDLKNTHPVSKDAKNPKHNQHRVVSRVCNSTWKPQISGSKNVMLESSVQHNSSSRVESKQAPTFETRENTETGLCSVVIGNRDPHTCELTDNGLFQGREICEISEHTKSPNVFRRRPASELQYSHRGLSAIPSDSSLSEDFEVPELRLAELELGTNAREKWNEVDMENAVHSPVPVEIAPTPVLNSIASESSDGNSKTVWTLDKSMTLDSVKIPDRNRIPEAVRSLNTNTTLDSARSLDRSLTPEKSLTPDRSLALENIVTQDSGSRTSDKSRTPDRRRTIESIKTQAGSSNFSQPTFEPSTKNENQVTTAVTKRSAIPRPSTTKPRPKDAPPSLPSEQKSEVDTSAENLRSSECTRRNTNQRKTSSSPLPSSDKCTHHGGHGKDYEDAEIISYSSEVNEMRKSFQFLFDVTWTDSQIKFSDDSEHEDDERENTKMVPAEHTPDKTGKPNNIAEELLLNESVYVERLRILLEVIYCKLEKTNQEHDFLSCDTLKQMFSHVRTIHNFHNDFLLKELKHHSQKRILYKKIGYLMKKNAPFLKLYTEYVQQYSDFMNIIYRLREKSPEFAAIDQEIQEMPECQGRSLEAYMVEPIQRVPRYELLLKEYLKHLPKDSPDRQDAEDALGIITKAASHSNETLKKIEEFNKLLGIYKRLGGDSPDLIAPTRVFVQEGPITKISARSRKKQARYLFLFNDRLIVCTSTIVGFYRVRAQLDVEGMKVVDRESQNIFTVHSKQKVIDFVDEKPTDNEQSWSELIRKVIDDPSLRRRSLPSNDEQTNRPTNETPLGKHAPRWIPDNESRHCMICKKTFTPVSRRHHCRACGQVICQSCSKMAPLEYKNYKATRVCITCRDRIVSPGLSSDLSPNANRTARKGKLQALRDVSGLSASRLLSRSMPFLSDTRILTD